MITIDYKGRLGNNIFQYCLARILSLHNNFAIRKVGYEYENVLLPISGKEFYYPLDNLGGHTQKINIEEAKCDNPRHILISGYFQVYDYYKEYKERIRNWLTNLDVNNDINKKDIVLHVRGGDLWSGPYNNHHPPCPYSYYNDILKNETFEKIWIVTENKNDIMANKIKDNWNAQIISTSIINDYNFIKSSTKIVLSLSTIAWWAAWLSDATVIYFPEIGMWNPEVDRNSLNLHVNEERYKYIRLRKMDDWAATPEQVEYILS
jgi:hypothetical protein